MPLCFHARQYGGDAVQHAANVDVEHLVPFRDFQRGEWRQGHDACVVDDHVDLAEFTLGEVGKCLHVGCIGDVQRAETHRAALRFDVCCQRLQTLGAPLHVIRSDAPSELIHAVHRPALCLIVQGRKEVGLGDEQYVYDPLSYLVVAVTVPVFGQVIEASCDAPYLCIRLISTLCKSPGLLPMRRSVAYRTSHSAVCFWIALTSLCLIRCCDSCACSIHQRHRHARAAGAAVSETIATARGPMADDQ